MEISTQDQRQELSSSISSVSSDATTLFLELKNFKNSLVNNEESLADIEALEKKLRELSLNWSLLDAEIRRLKDQDGDLAKVNIKEISDLLSEIHRLLNSNKGKHGN